MIRFASQDMATWVVENLNGNIPEGLEEPIICRYANASNPKGAGKGDARSEPYGGGGGAWSKGGGGKPSTPAASDNVWVGDLPVGIEKNDLATVFEAYGTIQECRVMPGKGDGKPCAMIRFQTPDMAKWVVENLNG